MNTSIRLLQSLFAAAIVGALPFTASGFVGSGHGVLASCTLSGPQSLHSVHAGERVHITINLQSICANEDVVTVTNIRVVIHHASGAVTMTNLLCRPLQLGSFVWQEVRTNVVVQAGDGEILRVEWAVDWADVPAAGGPSVRGSIRGGSHIQILPFPALTIRPAGAGAVQVSWRFTPGSRLETSLGLGQPWTPAYTIPTFQFNAALGYTELVATVPASAPAQFFRLAPDTVVAGTSEGTPAR